nr:hypothetical protein [Fibrobacter sp. UWR2]
MSKRSPKVHKSQEIMFKKETKTPFVSKLNAFLDLNLVAGMSTLRGSQVHNILQSPTFCLAQPVTGNRFRLTYANKHPHEFNWRNTQALCKDTERLERRYSLATFHH